MKKIFLQRISTLIAFILIIPLVVLSVVACTKTTDNTEENEQNQNVETPSVTPSEDTTTSVQKEIYNGIYYFQSDASFNDICYFVSDAELYSFFQTNDINGIKKYLSDYDFDSFLENITKYNGSEKYIEFSSNNKVASYTYENNEYTLINSNEFEYSYENSTFVSSGINPKVENDYENKKVTLYYPFYYTENDGTIVVTPLYVKTTLIYSTYSYEDVASDTTFIYNYQDSSCKLVYDFNKTIDTTEVLNSLATMFELENSENVLEDIESILSYYTISFASNFSVVTFSNSDNGLVFSYHNISSYSFKAFNNITVNITNKTIGVSTPSEITFSIDVTGFQGITLQYTIELCD